ncbi:M23 family metallopeptidase [Candidatus Chloroploca mongolica]|nr:peptidoglycan DD-metalloendopeptidase family protein [Candidatus Chloroploca mongolica]
MLSLRATLPGKFVLGSRQRMLACILLLVLLTVSTLSPSPAQAARSLVLPTPAGESWRIIQGYACGTHNSWDRYSLDLIQVNGPTYGAPIRAAANGTVWHWEARSGTLILHHGNQFFTMYTHLQRAVTTSRGVFFEAGQTLGYAGDRGSPGTPHLHFTAFTANRDGWSGKQSIPLKFAEGYDLPEIGGCNQHGGKVMTAMALQPPEVVFSSELQPDTWTNQDLRVEFTINWGGGGLSQAWNQEPAEDRPMFPSVIDGYAQLSDKGEGKHTLYVRAWGPDGKQTLASYGPVGFDQTPPSAPVAIPAMTVKPGVVVVPWQPAEDALSGVKGYLVYIGADPEGTSRWFTPDPVVKTEPLNPGEYLVRLQSLDHAGNSSPWTTIGTITVTGE